MTNRRVFAGERGRALLGCLLTGLLLMLANVALRRYLGSALDGVLASSSLAPMALWGLAGLAACGALTGIKTHQGWMLQHRLRVFFYHHACRTVVAHPPEDMTLGRLTSLLSGDVSGLLAGVDRLAGKSFTQACGFVMAAAAMAAIHPVIALVSVAAAFLPMTFFPRMSRRESKDRQAYLQELERVNHQAAQGLQSLETVKANALENAFDSDYRGALGRLYQRQRTLASTQALFHGPSILCAFVIQTAIVFVSGWFTATGRITPGEMVVVITLMAYVVDPVMCLDSTVMAWDSLRVSLERLSPLLGNEEAESEPGALPEGRGLRVEDVSFAYPGREEIIRGLNLTLSPGKLYVLRGGNGAGKSTLVRLICGTLRPLRGRVVLLGEDAAGLSPGALAQIVTVMPQECALLAGTVLENLLLARPEATRAQVEEACRRASIHEDIMALEGGYDAPLGENGGTLSGGQKQRVSFARCLLRPTPVMIFDEPSAALDDGHCALMCQRLKEMSRERVVLVITHDLRLMSMADETITLGRDA